MFTRAARAPLASGRATMMRAARVAHERARRAQQRFTVFRRGERRRFHS